MTARPDVRLGGESVRHVNDVSARLSLRAPQRQSLEILARVGEIVPLDRSASVAEALATIRSEYPGVTDFERGFPSLCFALATGVGKTRLMGAFVTYLYLAKGIRNFFVLAPNLTIYEKLIADFTPGTPKYVFQGVAEFAQHPPEIITGDNYESGRGARGVRGDLYGQREVHVNIFNISKIDSEVRGGRAPRIKRLSEYIGESYFDYLAGLPDLVLLMDESHRYRASAGVRAINELRPVLGLELTATPHTEAGGRRIDFRNVIYDYPLSRALADGFVKQPAVATRENFRADAYSEDELERIKLEDGVQLHENAKAELEAYALERDVPRVKPFMLVVAEDTAHADALRARVESDDFFEGRYRGRVLTVHSNVRGEERDETVERLLKVEHADEPTEIVIHVNKLKEGWDVTNLYTIVPLRAANARVLVEQTIGRGLRLPYGRRTGVRALDRLTIVAHDRFQEVVNEANRPESPLRVETVVMERDVPAGRSVAVVIPSNLDLLIGRGMDEAPVGAGAVLLAGVGAVPAQRGAPIFERPAERAIARATVEAVQRLQRGRPASGNGEPLSRAAIIAAVQASVVPVQGELDGIVEAPAVEAVVDRTIELMQAEGIDVPRIIVVPTGELRTGFSDFDLALPAQRFAPVDGSILVHGLVGNTRDRLRADGTSAARPEDQIVTALADFPDVSYDDSADLLYKLAAQLVAHLRTYLPDEDAVANAVRHHRGTIAQLIHEQLQAHRWTDAAGFDVRVHDGFTELRPIGCTAVAGEAARPFREPVDDRRDIRSMRFTGFDRCLYPEQRFDSDAERRFAVLLEDEARPLKWFRPAKGQLDIFYAGDRRYEPDFIVETESTKLLCEPKRRDEVADPVVQTKARAAAEWCAHASEHARAHGGKAWTYLLIPDDRIDAAATLDGLIATCAVSVHQI